MENSSLFAMGQWKIVLLLQWPMENSCAFAMANDQLLIHGLPGGADAPLAEQSRADPARLQSRSCTGHGRKKKAWEKKRRAEHSDAPLDPPANGFDGLRKAIGRRKAVLFLPLANET